MTTEQSGRTAVITGGARGFGKAFGVALASRGMHVVLIDLDGPAVEAAAAEIRAAGGAATGVVGDVADEARMGEIMNMAAAIHGGLDILINNAGLHASEYAQPIPILGLAKTKRLFEVNVFGVLICTLAAAPHMAGREGASIVNISSSAAYMGGTPYGDTKLAVAALSITFAKNLAPIRVNAIAPGLMLTETIAAEFPPEVRKHVLTMQFLQEHGEEQDVVDAMLFLTSPQARFITGETLRVTGGMSAGV